MPITTLILRANAKLLAPLFCTLTTLITVAAHANTQPNTQPSLPKTLLRAPISDNSLLVAVASNFSTTMKALKPYAENYLEHALRKQLKKRSTEESDAQQYFNITPTNTAPTPRIRLSFASSGKHYAQIKNGAPFDIFLSADQNKIRLLENEGLAIRDSSFTYTIGRLVLWAPKPHPFDSALALLKSEQFRRIAIANPKLAPYGIASQQTLQALGINTTSKRILGENISQTYQFGKTQLVDLAFVALSQVSVAGRLHTGQHASADSEARDSHASHTSHTKHYGKDNQNSHNTSTPHQYWLVPTHLHAPIFQDAALLRRAQKKPLANAFLSFLKSPQAKAIMSKQGYYHSHIPTHTQSTNGAEQ